jgi:cation transport ATPase
MVVTPIVAFNHFFVSAAKLLPKVKPSQEAKPKEKNLTDSWVFYCVLQFMLLICLFLLGYVNLKVMHDIPVIKPWKVLLEYIAICLSVIILILTCRLLNTRFLFFKASSICITVIIDYMLLGFYAFILLAMWDKVIQGINIIKATSGTSMKKTTDWILKQIETITGINLQEKTEEEEKEEEQKKQKKQQTKRKYTIYLTIYLFLLFIIGSHRNISIISVPFAVFLVLFAVALWSKNENKTRHLKIFAICFLITAAMTILEHIPIINILMHVLFLVKYLCYMISIMLFLKNYYYSEETTD